MQPMWYRCHCTLVYFVLGSNNVAFLMKNNLQLFSDKQIRACEENKVLSICQDMAYQITKPFYGIKSHVGYIMTFVTVRSNRNNESLNP